MRTNADAAECPEEISGEAVHFSGSGNVLEANWDKS